MACGLWPPGLFKRCQRGLGVLICLDSGDHRRDLAIPANHERGPFDPHVLSPIHAFLFEHAEATGQGLIFVRQQVKGKTQFLFELLLGRGLIGRDAKDSSSGFLKFLICVAEPGRLRGSTGGVGLCIKKQNYRFSAVIFKREVFPLLVGQRKIRGLIIDFHGFSHLQQVEFI